MHRTVITKFEKRLEERCNRHFRLPITALSRDKFAERVPTDALNIVVVIGKTCRHFPRKKCLLSSYEMAICR